MRDTLGRLLRGLAGRLSRVADRVAPPALSDREDRLRKWYAVNGDHTLRVEYDLSPASVVLDLGGFRGDWAAEIFARYRCPVQVFEPVAEFAAHIRKRFERNPHITVNECGLARSTRKELLSLCAEGSSAFRPGKQQREVQLVAAADYFATHNLIHIDLMKVNIEGGEYELLEHLVASGWIERIHDLQVQFHDDVMPAAGRLMRELQQQLERTHRPTYQHPFVWENWRRME